MFLSYYKLKTKPFQITTDSSFLWFGEKHKEAFATLKYGIWDDKGFLLLTGEVGAGKTTLLNALINSLNKNVIVARIADPGLSELDFYRIIARTFHFKEVPENKGDFLYSCTNFLNQAYKARKKVLLIVDEVQRISNELLEDIRLLSNIERENAKLLNIFFVGQSEFNEMLMDPKNRAIRQRITVNYNLETLKEHEVGQYIEHRLKVAGTDLDIFSPDAIHEVTVFSGGVPRLINVICDRALLTGYVNGKLRINSNVIRECAKELQIEVPEKEDKKGQEQISNSSAESAKDSTAEETSGGKKESDEISVTENEKGSDISLHFFYIILIILLLVVVGLFSFDVGELLRGMALLFTRQD